MCPEGYETVICSASRSIRPVIVECADVEDGGPIEVENSKVQKFYLGARAIDHPCRIGSKCIPSGAGPR